MSTYKKALDPTEIAAVKDAEIDFSDIPELDETFWREARLVEPDLAETAAVKDAETNFSDVSEPDETS